MGQVLTLDLPRWITLPRKKVKDKRYSINLNTYRNMHPSVNNACKVQAVSVVEQELHRTGQEGIRFLKPVTVSFQCFKPTKAIMDKSNVYAVATKYYYDALVKLEVLVDDNDDWILDEHLRKTIYEKGRSSIIFTFEEVD